MQHSAAGTRLEARILFRPFPASDRVKTLQSAEFVIEAKRKLTRVIIKTRSTLTRFFVIAAAGR